MRTAQTDPWGAFLVFSSAVVWSFGGSIARFLSVTDSWTVVFWRSAFAAAFLLSYTVWQYGFQGTRMRWRAMGWAGVGVACCFALASSCFVIALAYTTVAHILLIQAGVPLIAALLGFVLFREHVTLATWLAIGAVVVGVALMVSESSGGRTSAIGDGLALLVALAFAIATVVTRRHAEIEMLPAVSLGTLLAAATALLMTQWTQGAQGLQVSMRDAGLLFLFGVCNLGLGMAFFVAGARLVPAAIAALIGMAEPVLGPLWVWLIHNEVPSERTLLGGSVVFLALTAHLLWQFKGPRSAMALAVKFWWRR
jgi:drug/metabolite transporter (DMT)-like permease